MTTRFDTQAEQLIADLPSHVTQALSDAGAASVASVRQMMLTGYAQPVFDTGALHNSIDYIVEENTLHVGTPLPYAAPVHDGTLCIPARPFLRDGLLHSLPDMESALADALRTRIP